MSRYVDIERLVPMQVENSEVELGILVYDYDAVQHEPFIDIVFCGECKYNKNPCINHGEMSPRCRYANYKRSADDFCSHGEREGE